MYMVSSLVFFVTPLRLCVRKKKWASSKKTRIETLDWKTKSINSIASEGKFQENKD